MKQESIEVADATCEVTEQLDPTLLRRPLRVRSEMPANAGSERAARASFGARIKSLFASVTKALEGDHDFHHYLGG